MERRKCNEAYAKLLIKEQKCSDNEENANFEQTTFKRTNSVRASLRRLKGKLHAPSALQSPFTIRGPLSVRSKQITKRNLKTSDKSYAAKRYSSVLKMYETCEDLSTVALISNDKKRKSINEQERYSIKNKTEILLNKDCGIDLLMSGLPVGPVPRKACKLLQIPETYCLKYLEEQKRVQQQNPKQCEGSVECKNNNNKENILHNTQATENSFETCEKISREGIYGSTRLRTATIRKPVPYLNSNNVLSNNICDETTEVKLRHHQVDSDTKNSYEGIPLTQDKIVHCTNNSNNNNNIIIHQHYNNNNNQKILHLAEIAKVATIRTRNSCPSTDKFSNMKNFQMPHAITATTARISEKITASSSTRKFMKDFNEMPQNINDRNNTKIAEVTITKEKANSINAKNAKMSADVENSISTHVQSKSTNNSNNNNNSNNKNNNNNNKKNNNNHSNISKNHPITTTTETAITTTTTTTTNVVTRTKGGGNTPHRGKMSKKQLKLAQAQLDKLTQINLHQHALFSAIEHGHLDKARTILESTDIDVNSINSDGLSALDVAVLSNNRSMTRMLLQHGALESSQLTNENIGTKLNNQLKDAESRIHDLSDCLEAPYQPSLSARSSISSIIIGNTSSTVTGCTGNEVDKQIGIWERRVKGLRRMLLGWDQAQPPDGPLSVTVDVTSENTITVQILEPIDGAISTKFKGKQMCLSLTSH